MTHPTGPTLATNTSQWGQSIPLTTHPTGPTLATNVSRWGHYFLYVSKCFYVFSLFIHIFLYPSLFLYAFLFLYSFFFLYMFFLMFMFSLFLSLYVQVLFFYIHLYLYIQPFFIYTQKIYLICNKFQLKPVKTGLLRQPNQLGLVLVGSVAVPGCPFMGAENQTGLDPKTLCSLVD